MPNLNPATNVAGANISWNGTTLDINARYGFRRIYDNSAVRLGEVLFVVDDSVGDLTDNTLVLVTPYLKSLYGAAPSADALLGLQVASIPAIVAPFSSEGKRVLRVTGQNVYADSTSALFAYRRVPFSLVLQQKLELTTDEESGLGALEITASNHYNLHSTCFYRKTRWPI